MLAKNFSKLDLTEALVILDRTHSFWALTTGIASLVATVLYIIYVQTAPAGPSGGTWQGMLFGVSGTCCMIYAGLLAGRKKVPKWQIGSAQTWTKGHIWIGLLSVPFILFHCRFRWGGALEQLLMLTFAIVILSGIYGLALQQVLPRLLSTASPAQAIAPQVAVACKKLRENTELLVQKVCGATFLEPLASGSHTEEYSAQRELASFYWDQASSFLAPEVSPLHPLVNSTFAAARFARLKDGVPEELRGVVDEIQLACNERRQLMAQSRIQSWLHGWLCVHVPISVTLLILGLVHVFMSIYY
jgi:hypothetical protein